MRNTSSEEEVAVLKPILPEELPRIRDSIKQTTQRIFDNQAGLQAIVERHEETIQKRWIKKSKPKRREIILGVWPGMATDHRPDLVLLKRHEPGHIFEGKERDAFLWPWINQQDLCKNEPLLLLLNARARSPPHAFAHKDLQPSTFGLLQGVIPKGRPLEGYIMDFRNKTSPDAYGELVQGEWTAAIDAHGGDPRIGSGCCHSGDGLCTLEIQDRVYRFLLDVAKSVLHDIDDPTGVQYPIQPSPPLPSANARDDGVVSLAITNLEASYLAPVQADFARLGKLLEARASEAEDDLWAMREDPQSFASAVVDFIDHRPEWVPDIHGKLHTWTEPAGFETFRGGMPLSFRVSGMNNLRDAFQSICLTSAIVAVEFWDELRRMIGRAVALKSQQIDGKISPGDPLPKEFAMALYRLHDGICRSIDQRIQIIRQAAWASPPIRPYVRRATPQTTEDFVPISSSPQHVLEFSEILGSLFSPEEMQLMGHLAGVQSLMDQYEQFCSTPKNLEAVSPHVASEISNLALLSECLRQLQLFQPWASTFSSEMTKPDIKQELDAAFHASAQKLQPLQMHCFSATMCKTASKIVSMDYPVNKRRTKDNVEAMRDAEDTLDDLWSQILTPLVRALPPCSKRVLFGARSPARTPEWVEPTKKKSGKSAVNSGIESISQPFGALQVAEEKKQAQNQTSRPKEKIRGTPKPKFAPATEDVIAQPTESNAAQHTIQVDKRSLKVFGLLFFVPSVSAQPGECAWTEFLHAMHKVGFVIEKLYGSMWQFTPSQAGGDPGVGGKRSLLFHEPHPHSKIPFQHARMFGRRLHRAYGWSGETFVLE